MTLPPGPTGALQAFFLGRPQGFDGERFAVLHRPAPGQVRASVLYVQPLAEEMNRTRRMVALQARALAHLGVAVLLIDLAGCGDSAGDFGDATWSGWLHDVRTARSWLHQEYGHAPWLWGLRTGTLLVAQALPADDTASRLLMWQPVADGGVALRQLLRVQETGAVLRGASAAPMAEAPPAAAGSRTVAGYRLNEALMQGLAAARLAPPAPSGGEAAWFEVAASALPPAPTLARTAAQWQARGWVSPLIRVAGPAFWSSAEIETAPMLLDATIAVVRRWLAV